MTVRSKAEAQRRADDIACFRRELKLRLPSPRYAVEVAVGSRLEPRLVAVSTTKEGR